MKSSRVTAALLAAVVGSGAVACAGSAEFMTDPHPTAPSTITAAASSTSAPISTPAAAVIDQTADPTEVATPIDTATATSALTDGGPS